MACSLGLAVYTSARGSYTISTDPNALDIDVVERFLKSSYWAPNRSRSKIERSIRTSVVFGLFEAERQVGFARVVTDAATFAYLCDVFIDDSVRGKGLGKWLIRVVLDHPDLQGMRRWLLATRDAHSLYAQYGFVELSNPAAWMEVVDPTL